MKKKVLNEKTMQCVINIHCDEYEIVFDIEQYASKTQFVSHVSNALYEKSKRCFCIDFL